MVIRIATDDAYAPWSARVRDVVAAMLGAFETFDPLALLRMTELGTLDDEDDATVGWIVWADADEEWVRALIGVPASPADQDALQAIAGGPAPEFTAAQRPARPVRNYDERVNYAVGDRVRHPTHRRGVVEAVGAESIVLLSYTFARHNLPHAKSKSPVWT